MMLNGLCICEQLYLLHMLELVRYIIWENLSSLLAHMSRVKPRYLGRRLSTHIRLGHASGGAGYVISKTAVRLIVDDGPKFPTRCPQDGTVEDVDIGRYVKRLLVSAQLK